jgi:formylglycine-generating enzyme required for sulfatase activity
MAGTMMISMCEVPAGLYTIGDNHLPIGRPAHSVRLSGYAIGKITVTNEQFLSFMAADGYTTESLWSEMGWKWLQSKAVSQPPYLVDAHFNAPDQPIVGVCWYEAQAFTRWLWRETGHPWRLPTEAEWEAAARDSDGEAPQPRHYNTAERGLGHPWAVTSGTSASWCGALDMCGNVWEWCSTGWGHNWQSLDFPYPYNEGDGRENLEGSHARVMRGGSWFDPLSQAHPANRARYLPGSRGSNIGFRLAKSM